MASSIPIMQPVNLMEAAVRTPYYFSKKSGKTFRWEVNAVRHLFLISCAVRVDCITIKYVNRPTFKRYSKNVIYSVAYTSVHRFLRLLFACGKAELMLSFFLFGWFQLIVSINFWFPKKVIIIWQLTSLVRVAANVFKYLLKIDYMFLLKEIYIVSDQIGNHSERHTKDMWPSSSREYFHFMQSNDVKIFPSTASCMWKPLQRNWNCFWCDFLHSRTLTHTFYPSVVNIPLDAYVELFL